MLKRTPLFSCHEELGGRFVEFGGWEMPVQYSGITEEHTAVRTAAGLFDVSHMGEVIVSGPRALDFLQYVTSNDVEKLAIGGAQYSLLLNEQGGVVDDIIVYRLANEKYLLCVNASNTDKDFAWLQKHNSHKAVLENVSRDYAQVALQGPRAKDIIAKYFRIDENEFLIDEFPAFTFKICRSANFSGDLIVARTGYTGEDGFEIFSPADAGATLWRDLLAVGKPLGLKPAGLGARDTLRLEVCYPLHGHELRDDLSALSAKLGWVIKFTKTNFIGRDTLLAHKERGLEQVLVGLEVLDPGIVRADAKIKDTDGSEIGWVSSGTKTPSVSRAVALGFVPPTHSAVGTKLAAIVRDRSISVCVVKTPFYKRSNM